LKLLTKDDILELKEKLIDPFGGEKCLTPAGYDLRVGERIYFLGTGQEVKVSKDRPAKIPPRERFAIESLEKVIMQANLFGLIATRITLLSRGLTSLGTKIDPMFQDKLWLIFSNDSDTPLELEYEQRICNVTFFELDKGVRNIERSVRPILVPPSIVEKIEEPLNLPEVRKKYGLGVASIIEYARPRLSNHDKRIRGLERFRTAITSVAIGTFATFVVSLIIWYLTQIK
jgi:deoxycytidine triphosphate deaminase